MKIATFGEYCEKVSKLSYARHYDLTYLRQSYDEMVRRILRDPKVASDEIDEDPPQDEPFREIDVHLPENHRG